MQINDLGPATYFIDVHPPDRPCNSDPDSQWYQTTTIDGGCSCWRRSRRVLTAPARRASNSGSRRTSARPTGSGSSARRGRSATRAPARSPAPARNWVEWAPYTTGTYNDPVENPFVALSDSTTDQTVYVGQGDAYGNFDIQRAGRAYNLAVWDEQLSYIMRFKPVTSPARPST